MYYLINSDSINVLKISVRSTNGLHRMGIHNIESLIKITEQELDNTRNIGQKSIQEIISIINMIKTGYGEYCYVNEKPSENNHQNAAIPTFRGYDGILYYDIPISKIGVSVRALICLSSSGFQFASELIGLTSDKLSKINNMGKKNSEDTLSVIKTLVFNVATQISVESSECKLNLACQEILDSITGKITNIHMGLLYSKLQLLLHELSHDYNSIEADNLIHNISVIERIYEIDILKDAIKKQIIMLLEHAKYGLEYNFLQTKLPENTENTNILQCLLNEMLETGIIDYTINDNIQRKVLTAEEYALTLKSEKETDIFLGRINGKTLEELGQINELTRERIRQIVVKVIKHKPYLKEDYYADVYKKYYFSKSDFVFGFDEIPQTYNYLTAAYTSRSTNIEELISDESFPVYFRKVAEKIVFRNYIMAGDERIKCSRPELVDYVVRTYCREDTEFESFVELYEMFLEDYGLEKNEKLILNNKSYENRLSDSSTLLWKQWKRFRYYNIEQKDFDELLQTLSLEQYHDVEYSSYKFFRDYPELMRGYDIHDEYELHNLLKKIYKKSNNDYIKFKKMPTIEFGVANRDNQALDLLLQYAPITNIDLAAAYEEEYGVKVETVLANVLKSFDEYFYSGVYSIDAKPLPNNQLEAMKYVLKLDFYLIEEVKRIYLREFPGCDVKIINPYTLKTMEFRVYAGYVIKNRYSSAVEFFRFILTNRDIVDINEFPRELLGTVAFMAELSKLKSNYEIIEFSPMKYINIRRLISAGITLQQFKDYCNSVAEYVDKDDYFTIYYLRVNGFEHELDKLGFDDCFYASIISEEHEIFTYRRMGKTKVFVKGNLDVSLKGFIENIINREEKMDIYDLVDLLVEDYAVKTDKEKIIMIMKDGPLYYDSIMEKVYLNYDVYFEEV